MHMKTTLTVAVAALLAACGGADTEEPTSVRVDITTDAADERAAEAYPGARLAYPQEQMDYAAAIVALRNTGGVMFAQADHAAAESFACSARAQGRRPNDTCDGPYERVLGSTIFKPVLCREGDERVRPDVPALDPVTCAGLLDSEQGTAEMELTFYKTVGGEVKAGHVTSTKFAKR